MKVKSEFRVPEQKTHTLKPYVIVLHSILEILLIAHYCVLCVSCVRVHEIFIFTTKVCDNYQSISNKLYTLEKKKWNISDSIIPFIHTSLILNIKYTFFFCICFPKSNWKRALYTTSLRSSPRVQAMLRI